MPRPPLQPRRSEVDADELHLFDKALQRWLVGYMPETKPEDDPDAPPALGAELNSPPFAVAIGGMGTASRMAGERPGGMTHADREWVDQVLSYDYGYYTMLDTHTPDAVVVGVRLEAIEALREKREEDFTEREALVTKYIREIASRSVSDETYDAIEQDMGRRGAVEFTIFTCYFMFLAHLFMAFGGPIRTFDEIGSIIENIKAGSGDFQNWRQHIR